MSASSITTMVFDAYGTLYDVYSVEREAEAIFPGKGAAISTTWRQKQMEYMWLRSLMGRYQDFRAVTEASLRFTCESQGLAPNAAQVQRLMDVYLRLAPHPEAEAALKALSGYRCAILSNGTPGMLEALVGNTGLGWAFESIISVDSIRIYKPDPRVYELAVRGLGVQPSEVGFVSSNFWDAAGASSFGFNVFWINRRGALPEPLDFSPAARLSKLTALPAALEARIRETVKA
jgi:2-haloacid dehalogenase